MADKTPELRWSRREAIGRSMTSLALVCALPTGSSLTRTSGSGRAGATAAAATPFQADMRIPPTLVPVRRTATEDHYAVTIQEGRAEIIPGTLTPVYGYDGIYPGPTIRVRKGRTAVVRQTNALPFARRRASC